MNIINVEHLYKIYGEKIIFDDASFGIQKGDKIGIVGINGTGKSTLLKMIAGEETPDKGQIIKQNGLKLAYVPQNPVFSEDSTIRSYALKKGEENWKVESNLTELNITRFDQKIEHLSGGQKKRVVLAKILSDDFDVLLLDEPTNHLDEAMIRWLEEYLRSYKGTVIMVTHDRYFLDRVTNRILEISHGKMYGYDSDYSGFLELKAQREEMESASERKRQSVLRMELEWAKRGCRARTTKQRARLERLEQLKNGNTPIKDQTVELDSVETRMGKKTIELHHVSKKYGEKVILDDFSYIVLKNQRLGIIGPNGCGKSTLMKMIAGQVIPDSGNIEIGETIKIGYFAQENEDMTGDIRVIDYIRNVAEYIQTTKGQASASQMLDRFLFPPELQYTPLDKLSGGEQRRLYLLKVLMEAPNVLILDEPTNDLDIQTLTILEDYLDTFAGIVITVSHDRYFLDRIVNRIFAFEEGGHLKQYEGGYTDYLEKVKPIAKQEKSKPEKKENNGKKFQKEHQKKLKFTYKEQKEFETIDDDIAKLEEKIEQLDEEIMENATNSGKLAELTQQKEETEEALNEKMDRWVYLNDLAEKIEAQKRENNNENI